MSVICRHGSLLDIESCLVCDKDEAVKVCSFCNERLSRPNSFGDPVKSILAKNTWCFSCYFWHEKVDWLTNWDGERGGVIARVKGKHYIVYPYEHGLKINLGSGGNPYKVRWFDGKEMLSNNVWHQGEIPPKFKDLLPDNAEFI